MALDDLAARPEETGTSAALVRGVAAAIRERGGALCGFDAALSSTIRPGGGPSSPAAFEIPMGRSWNGLCNGGRFDALTLAMMGQGRLARARRRLCRVRAGAHAEGGL